MLQLFGGEKICLSFGTNEELFWENPEELISSLAVTRLSQAEAEFFKKHFSLTPDFYPREVPSWEQDILAGFGEYCFLDGIERDPYDD